MNVMEFKHRLAPLIIVLITSCVGPADRGLSGVARANDSPEVQNSPAEGRDLFARYGCATCHSLDGSEMYGPTLRGIYQKEIQVIRNGRERLVTVDRSYLERAITDPGYEKPDGYQSRTMPEPDIPREDVKLLLDYLTGL